MDVTYVLQGITFEWSSRKAATNFRKHSASFATACEAFFDLFLSIDDAEAEFIEGELREKVLGMTVDWRLLYVVYVMREDRIRIISARPATNSQRKRYEDR